MRVCQPTPVARNCVTTSRDSRMVMRFLVTSAFGLPVRTFGLTAAHCASVKGTASGSDMAAAALASQGRWVTVYFGWRPNLPDEGGNHLIELALAGGALAIVTHNFRDLRSGELNLGPLRVLTPAQCLETWT